MPCFAADEAASRRHYPKSMRVPGHDALLRYRVSRPSWVAGEVDAIMRTELFAWLMVGGRRVGAFEFAEYDPNGCGDNEDFRFLMDCDEWHEAHLSNVLSSAWRDIVQDVTIWGPILAFQSAWLAPKFTRGRLFADTVTTILDHICPGHAILIMPPFLLGAAPAPRSAEGGLTRLHAIMIRHFERTLGVRRLPGEYWHEGWLWRSNPRHRLVQPTNSAVVLPFARPADPTNENDGS
jgi:hypothetical protein